MGFRASFFGLSARFLDRSSLEFSWTKPARSGNRLVVTAAHFQRIFLKNILVFCSISKNILEKYFGTSSISKDILAKIFTASSSSLVLLSLSSEERGSCLLYNNYQMAVSMVTLILNIPQLSTPKLKVGISVTAKIISILCFILGYFFSRRSSITDSTKETKEDDLQQNQAQSNPAFDGEQHERWRQAYVPFGPEKTVKNN